MTERAHPGRALLPGTPGFGGKGPSRCDHGLREASAAGCITNLSGGKGEEGARGRQEPAEAGLPVLCSLMVEGRRRVSLREEEQRRPRSLGDRPGGGGRGSGGRGGAGPTRPDPTRPSRRGPAGAGLCSGRGGEEGAVVICVAAAGRGGRGTPPGADWPPSL